MVLIALNILKAQTIRGTIKSTKDTPLAYAHIISKESREITFTDVDGTFEIRTKNVDTLFISMIGYKDTSIVVQSTFANFVNITLRATNYDLPLTDIHPDDTKNKKILELIKSPSGNMHHIHFMGYGGTMAQRVDNPYDKTGKIEEIIFSIVKTTEATFVRLRLYDILQNRPNTDLLNENIIINIPKGATKIRINLEDKMILLPSKGCFIGIELIDPRQKRKGKQNEKTPPPQPGLKGFCIDYPNQSFTKYGRLGWLTSHMPGKYVSFDVDLRASFYFPKVK